MNFGTYILSQDNTIQALVKNLDNASKAEKFLFILQDKLFTAAKTAIAHKRSQDSLEDNSYVYQPEHDLISDGMISRISLDKLIDICYGLGARLDLVLDDKLTANYLAGVRDMSAMMGGGKNKSPLTDKVSAFLQSSAVPVKGRLHVLQERNGLSLSRMLRWSMLNNYLGHVLSAEMNLHTLVEDLPQETPEMINLVFTGNFEEIKMEDLILLMLKSRYELGFQWKQKGGESIPIDLNWDRYKFEMMADYEDTVSKLEQKKKRLLELA